MRPWKQACGSQRAPGSRRLKMLTIRPVIVFLIIAMVALGVIKRRLDTRSAAREESPDGEQPEMTGGERDLNDEFFANAGGETPTAFIRIYSNQDKMLIRSILDSAGIRSYQDMHHVGDLLPGVRVQGYTDSLLYIYESDREEAEALVVDYIRNRVEQLTGRPVNSKQALADAVALLNLKPTSRNQILPEFLYED